MGEQGAARKCRGQQDHEAFRHVQRAGQEGVGHEAASGDGRPQAEEAEQAAGAEQEAAGGVERAGHAAPPRWRIHERDRRSTAPSSAVVSAPKMATQTMPTRIMPG